MMMIICVAGAHHVWSAGPALRDAGYSESLWHGLVQWGRSVCRHDVWELHAAAAQRAGRGGRRGGDCKGSWGEGSIRLSCRSRWGSTTVTLCRQHHFSVTMYVICHIILSLTWLDLVMLVDHATAALLWIWICSRYPCPEHKHVECILFMLWLLKWCVAGQLVLSEEFNHYPTICK